MNQNIDDKSQGETGRSDTFESTLMALFGVLVLPVVISYWLTPRLASNTFIWRLKEFKKFQVALMILICLPLNLFFAYVLIQNIFRANWAIAFFILMLFWLSLLPIALATISVRLSETQTLLHRGMLSPELLDPIKQAIQLAGFDQTFRTFKKLGYVIPLKNKKGQSYLGLVAHQQDYRFASAKVKAPDRTILEKYLDEKFVTFDINAEKGAHHLVIGATGSGKSRLLSRMALSALVQSHKVVIMDFKGGNEKYIYAEAAKCVPNANVRIKMFPSDPVDLFSGTSEEIAERLVSFLPPATQSDGDYYRAKMIRALFAVIVRTDYQPPRDIDEVLRRVREGLSFANDPEDLAMFKQKERGLPVGEFIAEGLGSRFESLRRSGGYATHNGFNWSDSWDVAIFSFKSTSEGEVRLGGAILNSLDGWLWSEDRQTDPRPLLLIIDEGGVLQRFSGTPSLLNMVSRARSAFCGVVVASQTITSLGSDGEELLNTGPTVWLGRSPNPEALISSVGTKGVVEQSVQERNRDWRGNKTARAQRAFAIDPDVIRSLPTFFWNLSEASKNVYVFVPPIDYRPEKHL